jgi:hypothetical protein
MGTPCLDKAVLRHAPWARGSWGLWAGAGNDAVTFKVMLTNSQYNDLLNNHYMLCNRHRQNDKTTK